VDLSDNDIPGRPRQKSVCSACGEYIMDGREIITEGKTLCKNCAGQSYYRVSAPMNEEIP
jgi:formylmethanofuran dehydrogenase subunit E